MSFFATRTISETVSTGTAKHVAVDFGEQAGQDRERQRQLDGDRRSLAGAAIEFDGAVDVLNLRTDDVHSHAAAGDLGDLLGSAQPGFPDQLIRLQIRERVGVGLRHQSLLHRLVANLDRIEPFAVVLDLDHDAIASMHRVERDGAFGRLAGRHADLRQFDAVVGRIADDVNQRIAELVDHSLVELGVFAVNHEADFFIVRAADVAYDPLESREQRTDRHHARVHHALLNAVRHAVELMHGLEQFVDRRPHLIVLSHLPLDGFHFGLDTSGRSSASRPTWRPCCDLARNCRARLPGGAPIPECSSRNWFACRSGCAAIPCRFAQNEPG